MMPRTSIFDRKPLGQLLLSHGIVQAEQLTHAIETQAGGRHQKLLGEILVEQSVCTEEQITQTLALAYGVPYARLEPKLVDPRALAVLPAAFVTAQQVVPMFVVEGVLTVAVPEPANVFLTEELVRLSGLTVQVVAATAGDIRSALLVLLPGEAALPVAGDIDELIEPQAEELQMPGADPAAPADRLARYWLQAALAQRAGEISVEPGDGRSRIRFRDGGRWRDFSVVPSDLCRQTVDRLLAMAGLDANRPSNRAGRVRCLRQGRMFDIAMAVTPTAFGPSLRLHLPDPATRPAKLDKLGLSPELLQTWQTLSAASGGLLLIAGPIGSGKSTTLHATLREQLRDDRTIATVEHPLVHVMDGVTQIPVDPTRGFDLAAACTALFESPADLCGIDPLDQAVACRAAVDAVNAGRGVIAAVAGADIAVVLHRLRQHVADDLALSAALTGILSQRLVRKLCPACKEAAAPTENDLSFFGPDSPAPDALFKPRGCPQCQESGYLGRTGLFELLIPTEAMLSVPRRLAPQQWRTRVRAGISRSLRDDALDKLRAGVTSPAEVQRALA